MSDQSDIEKLYQGPLEEFTAARNALAKARKEPALKKLEKPSVPAWAVNQLFWQEPAVYKQLIAASERLRREHRKLLAGKTADVRDAERQHRALVREALEHVRALLQSSDQPASDATLSAVQQTLESLPGAEQPGRLTRPLKPMGFEALAGVAVAPGLRIVSSRPAPAAKEEGTQLATTTPDVPASKAERARAEKLARQREEEERERKKRQQEAEQALAAAERHMLAAEEAVKQAERELAERRVARDRAVREYQQVRLRAHE